MKFKDKELSGKVAVILEGMAARLQKEAATMRETESIFNLDEVMDDIQKDIKMLMVVLIKNDQLENIS